MRTTPFRWLACAATAAALAATGGPAAVRAADSATERAFEAPQPAVPATPLDQVVAAAQRKRGIEPADACSDAVFVRRVHLDLLGTLPEPADVRAFLLDRRPNRRALLVESLFAREEFADWWSLLWCDALRVKSEFPINLWPNAAQAYHRWVREAIRENRPYDRFAHDLLTASGSNFRDPPVNFWRAVQGRDPQSLAGAVALTFLGTRLDRWPAERRAEMAVFFSRVSYKATTEWKEEIVLSDPAPRGPLDAVLPGGTAVRIGPDEDPRRAFADWLVTPENPWFAKAVVNRIWAWLLGRGLVHEPDDLRPDNPPVIPEALAHLERELVASGWDLRHVIRTIVNSRTYQQSPIPRGDLAKAEAVFACYPVRRLPAEVLIDALCWLSGTGEGYTSNTPEPWTFIPEDRRTISLADGSITSAFLEMFGRPSRDAGLFSERILDPTDDQRLWLLNSTEVQRRIERSPRLRAAAEAARGDVREYVRQTYLVVLSRFPTDAECDAANSYFVKGGRNAREAAADLAWALVNTKEFLFRH